MNEDFLQSEDQSVDQFEHQSKHPDGHNVIIMSNAAKPIFCRWGNEKQSRLCWQTLLSLVNYLPF